MVFNVCRVICRIVAAIFFRMEITGRENIPKEGAFLLCSNHIHAFDPIVLCIFIKRRPRFMAKQELFKPGFYNWFFRSYGAFPIDRSVAADMTAYRTSMDLLKNGHGLVIFSQGTRMKDFENAKSGVAVFALKSGAPIVPVGIVSTYKLFSKIQVNYGEPICMDEYAGEKVKTELVERVMGVVVERVSRLSAP
ncbi:MAG: 1-acyl-sn-glycerol-3-phosphate acyltransferase [Defluviitaleaceae bacterium]|nr:1-acyl-sn-glycerol-3-phosphate acyltransferase [Defluviitaleaceae bacterium]